MTTSLAMPIEQLGSTLRKNARIARDCVDFLGACALSTLRYSKGARVHGAVRPRESEPFEFVREKAHRLPSVEREHVRDVLEHQPTRRDRWILDEPEHLTDET